MTEFVEFRPKTYSYLIDGGSSDKKTKGTKNYVIKRRLKFAGHVQGLQFMAGSKFLGAADGWKEFLFAVSD